MGIEPALESRIISIGVDQEIFPGGDILILGDCKFYTSWATGDNAVDREIFRKAQNLNRLETIDIVGSPSIRFDLHKPLPTGLANQFDMIIDAGTVYWCFNPAAVMENCFSMLKDRGVMVHQSALTGYFGRGYYNIHPTWFKDLYGQNDFEILTMAIRVHKQNGRLALLQKRWSEFRKRPVGEFVSLPKGATFVKDADFVSMDFTSMVATTAPMLPNDAQILCAARRTRRSPFVVPVPSF